MLTYDSLIEQAKAREMPLTKMRGILREYIQILILKELYRTQSGRKLYFTGGTYLRLAHNIKRFSEDLDFNTDKMTKTEFEKLLKKIKTELERSGVSSEIKFAHWDNMYVAKIAFPELEKVYNVVSKYSKKQGIVIKVEANRSRYKIETESWTIAGFGEVYPCICAAKRILFADKIDALTKKRRGRHIYDIIFMLSNKYPINKKALLRLGVKEDPMEFILKGIRSFSKIELKNQAESLKPFLFDESDSGLIANAHDIIPSLLERYA